jgi:hypothetical protein
MHTHTYVLVNTYAHSYKDTCDYKFTLLQTYMHAYIHTLTDRERCGRRGASG